ncbi:aldo/keto reductase [Nonomuraea insulae]|uniref:Aldo/keto reductase n=1 Tax=Nonomuraea insulae TaxID=1616787 RepID=A0ABW1CKM7_9ACTN
MQHTTFGRRTGLRVSEYALGTSNFATTRASGAAREQFRAIFDTFAEAGGTFLDSADAYQGGEAESALGELLAGKRDHFVLATKYTRGVTRTGTSGTGNSRKTMISSLEASLKRLGTDYVDLYWAHLPDTVTPVDEIVAAFDDLVRSGKILHGGLSNFPAWRVATAATLADLRDRAPIIGIQVEYSLAERTADRELLPMAEAFGLGAALYAPLAGGLLTGKYRHSDEGRLSRLGAGVRTEDDDRTTAIMDTVLAIAGETGATPTQVSVAWLRAHAARSATALIPVIGPRTLAQLREYLDARELALTEEHYRRLERVSAVPLGTPHETVAATLPVILGGEARTLARHPVPVI